MTCWQYVMVRVRRVWGRLCWNQGGRKEGQEEKRLGSSECGSQKLGKGQEMAESRPGVSRCSFLSELS